MRRPLTFTRAAALGAVAMYLWDPQNGKRRRKQLAEKTLSLLHGVDRGVETGMERLSGCWQNFQTGAKKAFQGGDPGGAEDSKLIQTWEHATAGSGGGKTEGLSFLREPLSPKVRWIAGGAGALLVYPLISGWSLKRVALGAVGLALVARAVVNGQAERPEPAAEHEEHRTVAADE